MAGPHGHQVGVAPAVAWQRAAGSKTFVKVATPVRVLQILQVRYKYIIIKLITFV
jgi:hypothetical protein